MNTKSAFLGALCAASLMTLAIPIAAAQTPGAAASPDWVALEAASRQDRIEELEFLVTQTTADNERLQMELRAARQEIARLQRLVSEMAAANQAANQALEQTIAPPAEGGAAAPQTQDERIAAARNAAAPGKSLQYQAKCFRAWKSPRCPLYSQSICRCSWAQVNFSATVGALRFSPVLKKCSISPTKKG